MALLFITVLMGRAIGGLYASYQEVSELRVVFSLGEEDIAGFIRNATRGEASEMDVGMTLTLPSAGLGEQVVTQLPDYARRWFISVTLSPLVVRQPEVSDVEVTVLVEGEAVQTSLFEFEREKVPYLNLLDRSILICMEDIKLFTDLVNQAADRYNGEVSITLKGQALVHLFFLETWLPFTTTKYPLVRVPHLDYISSGWADDVGSPIGSQTTSWRSLVQFKTSNAARFHSVHENVTAKIYREGSEEPVHTAWKIASVAPDSSATYFFEFRSDEPGVYYYTLEAEDAFSVGPDSSQRLTVHEN